MLSSTPSPAPKVFFWRDLAAALGRGQPVKLGDDLTAGAAAAGAAVVVGAGAVVVVVVGAARTV